MAEPHWTFNWMVAAMFAAPFILALYRAAELYLR